MDMATERENAEKTEKKDTGYTLTAAVSFYNAADGTKVRASLSGGSLDESADGVVSDNRVVFSFSDLDVAEWNAEAPTLYDLFIETETSAVKLRVGFRDIRIEKDFAGHDRYASARLLELDAFVV